MKCAKTNFELIVSTVAVDETGLLVIDELIVEMLVIIELELVVKDTDVVGEEFVVEGGGSPIGGY